MNPITEDQVVSLMDGLAAREKVALSRLQKATKAHAQALKLETDGSMTARILAFGRNEATTSCRTIHRLASDVIPFQAVRSENRDRRTVEGVFVFNARSTA